MTTLYIKATFQNNYDGTQPVYSLTWACPDSSAGVSFTRDYYILGTRDPSATPYAIYTDHNDAMNSLAAVHGPAFISYINGLLGTTYYVGYDAEWIDSPVKAALAAIPAAATRVFANPARTLNSAYQISATQDAAVSYAVDIAASLSLTGGQTGLVTLQYADDSGMTTNVKTVNAGSSGNTGTLTVGLGLTQTTTVTVTGIIPKGKYAKLLTANSSGTPTFTFRSAQEVLI